MESRCGHFYREGKNAGQDKLQMERLGVKQGN